MSQERNYSNALRDILQNAHKAQRFLSDVKYEDFIANDEKAYAVYHALAIIGEAARAIPASVRRQHRQIPWDQVTGMRDRLIRGYSGVDLRPCVGHRAG
jgi:uncharacterized protein with HEPN domain